MFRKFEEKDYPALCGFLVELNKPDAGHINWNWARLEWMYGHPEFDTGLISSVGLWEEDGKIVGAAIYDMYFGEAFCAVLPEHFALYPEILRYAYENLSDEKGLGIAINDENERELAAARLAGFEPVEQDETLLRIDLSEPLAVILPEGIRLSAPEEELDDREVQWVIWQGFDHGPDRAEFERDGLSEGRERPHFDRRLAVGAFDEAGNGAGFCILWYRPDTDYAYVEPVCTVPEWRGRGVGRAMVSEALSRAREYGAKRAYVISDSEFYRRLGFVNDSHYSFWWKK